jgi:hypothetical protein
MYVEPGTFFVTDSYRERREVGKAPLCAFYILPSGWCRLVNGKLHDFDYFAFGCRCDVAIIVGNFAVTAYPATEEEAFELASLMLKQ